MKSSTIKINKNIEWLNIINPDEKAIKELENKFHFHPIILDELLNPSDRPKVEHDGPYLFIVYHLPIYNQNLRTSRKAEIDFIITKNALVTVSYEKLEPLTQAKNDIQKILSKNIKTTGELVYYILKEFNEFSLRQLQHIEAKVNFVGEQLFKSQDKALLEEISYIKRDILGFAMIITPQRNILESLIVIGTKFWGEKIRVYFSDSLDDFLKTHYLLENLKATIESFSQTVSQIFEFRTSRVIRRFSVLAFLTFPLILFATIALQPTVEPTFIKTPADYWISLGIVAAIVVTLAFIFRKKGWF